MSFQDLEAGQGNGALLHGFINGKQQDPTQAVAYGIFQINTAVSAFQRLVNTLGTPKDTPELRDKIKHAPPPRFDTTRNHSESTAANTADCNIPFEALGVCECMSSEIVSEFRRNSGC